MKTTTKTTWEFWKIVAVIMIICNFFLFLYLLTKFNLLSGIRDTAHNIDSAVVFSLTLLQTFIAFGAFGGFWVIKSSAESKAVSAAREVANERMAAFIQQSQSSRDSAPDNNPGAQADLSTPQGATLVNGD